MEQEQKTSWGKKHLKALGITLITSLLIVFLMGLLSASGNAKVGVGDGTAYFNMPAFWIFWFASYVCCAAVLLIRQAKESGQAQ